MPQTTLKVVLRHPHNNDFEYNALVFNMKKSPESSWTDPSCHPERSEGSCPKFLEDPSLTFRMTALVFHNNDSPLDFIVFCPMH
jgi:hypothetical protein